MMLPYRNEKHHLIPFFHPRSIPGKGKIYLVTPDLPAFAAPRTRTAVVNFEILDVEQILLRAMSKEPLQLQALDGKNAMENAGNMDRAMEHGHTWPIYR